MTDTKPTRADALNLTAGEVMTREILTASADWTLDRLAEFLVEYSISGAPVTTDNCQLLGVVSSTDLVRYRAIPVKNPIPVEPHRFYLEGSLMQEYADEDVESFRMGGDGETTVRDIMTFAIFNVEADATLSEVADTMVTGGIHRVFVTRGDCLIGIISALDILKALIKRR